MEFFRGVNMDWLGKKWYFLAFSLIFSVAGIVSMAWHWKTIGSPVPLGVDFRGGTEVQVQFKQRPDIDAIRQAVDAAGFKDAKIQNYGGSSGTQRSADQPARRAQRKLARRGPPEDRGGAAPVLRSNPFDDSAVKVDVVGPTVGHQLEKQAGLATLYSLLGMLVYLWFRFQLIYGVAAVVACFHDTLITSAPSP